MTYFTNKLKCQPHQKKILVIPCSEAIGSYSKTEYFYLIKFCSNSDVFIQNYYKLLNLQ